MSHEIGLTESQYSFLVKKMQDHRTAVNELMKQVGSGDRKMKDVTLLLEVHEKDFREVLDEMITPEQTKRLTQIAYRIEISRIGYSAIATGRLSDAIGVHQQQRDHLSRKISDIENEFHKKLDKLRIEFEQEIFAELTAEQRQVAQNLMGKPFSYSEVDRHIQDVKRGYEEWLKKKAQTEAQK